MRLSFLLLLLLITLLSQAQYNQSDSAIRSRIVHDLYVLASDSLEGRRSGTRGELKAAEYIQRCFIRNGLKPAGDSGLFLQKVPYTTLDKWDLNSLHAGTKHYWLRDFSPVSFTANGEYTGEITTEVQADDLRGKCILYDLQQEKEIRGDTGQIRYLYIRGLAERLLSRHAGVVIFWDSKGKNYKELYRFSQSPDPVRGLVMMVNNETGQEWSSKIKRNHKVIIEVNLTRPVYKTDFFHNIIGYLDNHAPYTIIIGAHYDHMGYSKRGQIRYGADDNASGTATVMELARYLSSKKDTLNNYLFICFSGEEEMLIGSDYFAAHPTIDLAKANYMINFDMVGRLGCEGNVITAIGYASSDDWPGVFKALDAPFRVHKLYGAGRFSDHSGFYLKRIPFVYLTTGFHYDYHTPNDRPDRINYDGMTQIVKYTENFIAESEKKGRITYNKVSGWHQFTSMWHYVTAELDYQLVMGTEGAE